MRTTIRASIAGLGLVAFALGYWAGTRRHPSVSPSHPMRPVASSLASDWTQASSITEPADLSPDASARTIQPAMWEWQNALGEPPSPLRDEKLSRAIESLAWGDPERAMSVAVAERSPRLRQILIGAALRGWASHDGDAAAEWLLTAAADVRESGAEAVLIGAAHRPDVALRVMQKLAAAGPSDTGGYGRSLIEALGKCGAFESAVQFALTSTTPQHRAFWIHSAFLQWAQYEPQRALAAARQTTDVETRAQALQAALSGWSANDPSGAVEYLMQLGDRRQQSLALAEVLPRWVSSEPKVAAEWINRHASNADFDAGAAAVATYPSVLESQPETAATWAATITESHLRNATLRTVIDSWSRQDATAAKRYVETATSLTADERESLLEEVRSMAKRD